MLARLKNRLHVRKPAPAGSHTEESWLTARRVARELDRILDAEGIDASGLWPGDTVFMQARNGRFDVVVAQYHDQGLIPVKYLGLEKGVNITQLQTALGLGVRHIGFKDIGLPIAQLKALNAAIKAGGATSYLEVVSLDRDSEIASARAALEIGVDVLLGGTRAEDVLPVIAGADVKYCPFPGRIVGHPSVLEGSIEEIVESAKALAARGGVHGLDLLAYRSKEDVPALIKAVCAAVSKPVYIAGSIDTPERIAIIKQAGAAGFTIGTAALEGKYPADGRTVPAQLSAIIRDVARLNNHLSPFSKRNLAASFSALPDTAAAMVSGQINDQIKLARFRGPSAWHFDLHDDKLIFVHKGRLRVEFRDREEIVEEGEFIVVPHGVEHRPAAIDGVCEAVTIAPGRPA